MRESWKTKWQEICGIDLRSLVLFRIGLALVLLCDISVRVPDIEAFYTDAGTLPRNVWIYNFMDPYTFSFHLSNGTWYFQAFLFLLQTVFALALLVGYKTRLAAFLSWLLLCSLHSRNSIILQGGDDVLRLLLFWALFLPLGALGSLDASFRHLSSAQKMEGQRENASINYQVVSAGTLGLLLQVCFIYWFTALLKNDSTWRAEGSAIWYSLSIEQYATPLGTLLLSYPHLLEYMTHATFYLEMFGPFFAFSPVWTGPLRLLTAVAFILFHVGLDLTMELAHFPYICAVGWLAFFPSFFWDSIWNPTMHFWKGIFNRGQDRFSKKWASFLYLIYGNASTPQTTEKTHLRAGWFANILSSFFIFYIFLWNVSMLRFEDSHASPWLSPIASVFHIDQYWNMFSPYPLTEDGWFVIPAKLKDGTIVDLFAGGKPVSWKKPDHTANMYPNDRWRSYMMNLVIEDDEVYLMNYAQYIAKKWDESHPKEKHIEKFVIVFMSKFNVYWGPPEPAQKKILWEQTM